MTIRLLFFFNKKEKKNISNLVKAATECSLGKTEPIHSFPRSFCLTLHDAPQCLLSSLCGKYAHSHTERPLEPRQRAQSRAKYKTHKWGRLARTFCPGRGCAHRSPELSGEGAGDDSRAVDTHTHTLSVRLAITALLCFFPAVLPASLSHCVWSPSHYPVPRRFITSPITLIRCPETSDDTETFKQPGTQFLKKWFSSTASIWYACVCVCVRSSMHNRAGQSEGYDELFVHLCLLYMNYFPMERNCNIGCSKKLILHAMGPIFWDNPIGFFPPPSQKCSFATLSVFLWLFFILSPFGHRQWKLTLPVQCRLPLDWKAVKRNLTDKVLDNQRSPDHAIRYFTWFNQHGCWERRAKCRSTLGRKHVNFPLNVNRAAEWRSLALRRMDVMDSVWSQPPAARFQFSRINVKHSFETLLCVVSCHCCGCCWGQPNQTLPPCEKSRITGPTGKVHAARAEQKKYILQLNFFRRILSVQSMLASNLLGNHSRYT